MRKTLILSLIFGVLFTSGIKTNKKESITGQGEEFTIYTKSIRINLKPYVSSGTKISLTHAIKYEAKYYCYFNEEWKAFAHSDVKHFFILSKDGKIEKSIELPDPLQNCSYFDLFILHDTIYTKPYMREKSYYLDLKTSHWIETKAVDDVIYEDKRFYVTYLDFGEWGSTTWFTDKLSGKEYELKSSGTIINRVESGYYITSNTKVLQIADPLKMKECPIDYYYETIKNKDFSYGSSSILGTKSIYNESTHSHSNFKEPKIHIVTSFKANSQLYYLCVDNVKTYIAKLVNKKLFPIQNISGKYSTFDWNYSYRCKIQNDGFQLLKFSSDKKNEYGFIELNGLKINIQYLKLIK